MAELPEVGAMYAPDGGTGHKVLAVIDHGERASIILAGAKPVWIDLDVVAADPLPEAKVLAAARIEARRDRAIYGGFTATVNGTDVPIQSDPVSIRNVQAIYSKALEAEVFGEHFAKGLRAADDTMVPLDIPAARAVGNALEAHIETSYLRSWELKAAVDAAADPAALAAIDIEAGWPGEG